MKRKVLFCLPPSCGGAERVTLTIAKLLDREKYDIKVVIVGKTMGEIKEFVPDYMEIIHVKIRNIWDFTTWRLTKLFKRENPYSVFCSLMSLNTRVILAARLVGGIKIIIRNNNALRSLRLDNVFLVRMLYRYADAIVLQTDEMKEEIQRSIKINDDKLHVIFNPIDTDTIERSLCNCTSPMDEKYTNFVFVGRISYVKGLDVLFQSFARLVHQNQKVRLYIVGKINKNDQYYKTLKKQISELGIEENVMWTGFTKNPYQYIKYSDCFVLPSRVEGLPNVLLDAMYLKVPVVVTRSVPVIDRIVSKKNGIVVDVDDVDALTQAMEKAIRMKIPESREILSQKDVANLFV